MACRKHILATTALVLLSSTAAMAEATPLYSTYYRVNDAAYEKYWDYPGSGMDYVYSPLSDQNLGAAGGSSSDAFGSDDNHESFTPNAYHIYGMIGAVANKTLGTAYDSAFNGLSVRRGTETFRTNVDLSPIGMRWLDSFTNETAEEITTNIRFYGELNDSATNRISRANPGFILTYSADPSKTLVPTIAHIYSDPNYAHKVQITQSGENLNKLAFDYTITVAAGETVSIMVVNQMFADVLRNIDQPGASQRERDAAIAAATSFVNSPIFTGLSVEQIASIVNFNNVKMDGSLPSASAGARLSGSALSLFNNLLDINRSFSVAGANLNNGNLAPMAYMPLGGDNSLSDAAAQIANLLGQAGGRLASGDDQSQIFMLGGYTRGSDKALSEKMDYDGYAVALGYETHLDNANTLGLIGGYLNTTGEMGSSYSDISGEQVVLSPYLRSTLDNGITLDGRLSLSSDNWSYLRTAGAMEAAARYDGYTLGASLEASKAFESDIATLTPFARLSFQHGHFNAYSETGAGNANLDVPSYRVNALEAFAGIGMSKQWQIGTEQQLVAFGNIGLGKGFGQDQTIQTAYSGSTLTYDTLLAGEDDVFARINLGATVSLSEKANLMLSYSGDFNEDAKQHSISSKLAVKF